MAINTSPYGAPELRELLGKLERLSEAVRDALAWVEHTDEPLFVFKKSSQIDGMKRLRGFEHELTDSLIAAKSGRPYTAETLKPRATPKAAPPKIPGMQRASDIAAPDDSHLDEEIDRTAKRGSTKKKATDQAKGGRKKKSG